MKTRTNSIAVVICLLAILLVGCQTAEQRLQDLSEDIGVPTETFLLTSRVEARQGSQDACYFTSLFELYGSRLPIEQVFEYYSTKLTNNGWAEDTPSRLPEDKKDTDLLFQRDNSFRVAISEPLPDEIDYLFGDIQEAAEPYATMYLVNLTYANAIAQRGCPVWQSE